MGTFGTELQINLYMSCDEFPNIRLLMMWRWVYLESSESYSVKRNVEHWNTRLISYLLMVALYSVSPMKEVLTNPRRCRHRLQASYVYAVGCSQKNTYSLPTAYLHVVLHVPVQATVPNVTSGGCTCSSHDRYPGHTSHLSGCRE